MRDKLGHISHGHWLRLLNRCVQGTRTLICTPWKASRLRMTTSWDRDKEFLPAHRPHKLTPYSSSFSIFIMEKILFPSLFTESFRRSAGAQTLIKRFLKYTKICKPILDIDFVTSNHVNGSLFTISTSNSKTYTSKEQINIKIIIIYTRPVLCLKSHLFQQH